MIKRIYLLSLFIFMMTLLFGCQSDAVVEDGVLAEVINVETAHELHEADTAFFVDVREDWEYDNGHIPDITHIPMAQIMSRLDELPTDVPVVLTCAVGGRSGAVLDALQKEGYTNIHNMDGGIVAWEKAGYSVEK